jgi:hypothetical protein
MWSPGDIRFTFGTIESILAAVRAEELIDIKTSPLRELPIPQRSQNWMGRRKTAGTGRLRWQVKDAFDRVDVGPRARMTVLHLATIRPSAVWTIQTGISPGVFIIRLFVSFEPFAPASWTARQSDHWVNVPFDVQFLDGGLNCQKSFLTAPPSGEIAGELQNAVFRVGEIDPLPVGNEGRQRRFVQHAWDDLGRVVGHRSHDGAIKLLPDPIRATGVGRPQKDERIEILKRGIQFARYGVAGPKFPLVKPDINTNECEVCPKCGERMACRPCCG